jgi:hypothetical protein
MKMSEIDPLREAIHQGRQVTITFDAGIADETTVTPLSVTTAYLAYEYDNGDAVIIPWWQIEKVTIRAGSGRAL